MFSSKFEDLLADDWGHTDHDCIEVWLPLEHLGDVAIGVSLGPACERLEL